MNSSDAEIERLNTVISGLEQTSKMLINRDINLRNAYDELKSLDIEKTEFVSIAAHQLRTPVTTARWAVQYILSESAENLNEKQLQLLDRAHQSIEHVYELVEELLELNRIDFGAIEMNCKPTSIEALCSDIIADHAKDISQKRIHFTKKFARETCEANIDSRKIRDAIDNLVDNAIKYTDFDGSITVQTEYSDEKVSISVIDDGIGVAKGDEKKIFQKFTRLGNAEKVDPNGIGLGLYIGKKIIEKHNGTLNFQHNQLKGSIFTATLPC